MDPQRLRFSRVTANLQRTFEKNLKERLLAGYVESIDPHRNLSYGMSGLSFGEFRKQPLSPDKYPQYDINGETVHFDMNPIYSKVMILTLEREDNRATWNVSEYSLLIITKKVESKKRTNTKNTKDLCSVLLAFLIVLLLPKPRAMTSQTKENYASS